MFSILLGCLKETAAGGLAVTDTGKEIYINVYGKSPSR